MSTRSMIYVVAPAGAATGVYCHFDGYPDGVGNMLVKHYNTLERARALVALGSLSYVGSRLAPPVDRPHSFIDPVAGVTVAYHRDRGEEFHQYKTTDVPALIAGTNNDVQYEEFMYIFDDGKWHAYDTRHTPVPVRVHFEGDTQ